MRASKMKLAGLMGTLALGLVASPAGAEWLTDITTNHVNIAYWILDPATCELSKTLTEPDQAGLQELLRGSNSECVPNVSPGPGGNIELGDDDTLVWEEVSTLEGNICGGRIRLSSLTRQDWDAVLPSGNTVAEQYVADAIFANCGVFLTPAQINSAPFQTAVNDCFLGGSCGGGPPIVPPPAQRASDPNVAYVNSNSDGSISIGLAGNLDASDLLPPGFDCSLVGGQQQGPVRASEVVKIEVLQGGQPVGKPQYGYSFAVYQSGIETDDETASYDGTYPTKLFVPPVLLNCRPPRPPVPIPAVPGGGLFISLVGLGFAGIRSLRRRSAGDAKGCRVKS